MNETKPPKEKTHSHKLRWVFTFVLLLVVLAEGAYLAFTGRLVNVPASATTWVEDRVNERIAPLRINVGRMGVFLTRQGVPRVQFNNVDIYDAADQHIVALSELRATLRGNSLITGEPLLRRVAMSNAQVSLRRELNGQLDLVLGGAPQAVGQAGSLVEILDQIDAAFAAPLLAAVESFSVEHLSLWYFDTRSNRSWLVEDGLMVLEQSAGDISLQVFFSLFNGTETPAEVATSFATQKGSRESRLSVSFSDVQSVDVAAQSPALAFLSTIDAPISGALRTGLDADGNLAPLSAALEIGQGVLAPVEGIRPVAFNRGRSYFSYEPDLNRFEINSLEVDAEGIKLRAEGQGFLEDFVDGWPETMVLQTGFNRIALDPEGLFEEPAVFEKGAMDLKIGLDPFVVRLGQLSLIGETGEAYHAKGEVGAQTDGWRVSVDAKMAEIDRDRILAFWPLEAVPLTRKWIANNVLSGVFTDVNAALRVVPGKKPVISLTHGFRDATVRFMKYMPLAERGAGYASINDNVFTLVVEEASVTPQLGGSLSAAGTVVQIKDLSVRNPPMEVIVRAEGPIAAKLSLLDQRPLHILSKSDLPYDLADGHAKSETKIELILRKQIKPKDVAFQSSASLYEVTSEKLVKDRVLEAEVLEVVANNEQVTIGGLGSLDNVPVRATWSQAIGPGQGGFSSVSGRVALTPEGLETFRIGLPEGSVRGQGAGFIELDLPRGEPASFRLTSDLEGLALGLPGLGWSSPADATGVLEVTGTLGTPAGVERLRLEASGLTVDGSVSLTDEGLLDTARLTRVKLGDWLDAPVVLRGRGEGVSPAISVEGGLVDLRNLPERGGGGAAAGIEVIQVALDRLQISEKLHATAVQGELVPRDALAGQFTARVNGGAPVTAALIPATYGSAIRVRSDNAGEVLRSAGIIQNANGGSFDLILRPRAEKDHYDGVLQIDGPIRVKGVPALAELLNALSVVGVLDLLSGEGLSFANAEVEFLLTPNALQIKRGAATGPSLGISMEGVFDLKQGRMEMQGVISPVYMLNVVGSIFRRGEGLFGFNYRMTGDPADPKVSVNPLSVLTPGLFREIFRRPPPEIPE